jgi:hypothetical protein
MKKIRVGGAIRKLPVHKEQEVLANLKRNWYFPFSALAFFCMETKLDIYQCLGILIAVYMTIFIATQTDSIWKKIQESPVSLQVISILSAIGVCWAGYVLFCEESYLQDFEVLFSGSVDLAPILGFLLAVASLFFVFCGMLFFWEKLLSIMKESQVLKDIPTAEYVIYIVLLVLTMTFMVISFMRSEAFYGTDYDYDLIYTGDSPAQMKGNACLALLYYQNDLRQPLFAVFAAPFVSIPYLIGKIFCFSDTVRAILINCPQILMLFFTNFLLAKILRLDSMKRIAFLIFQCSTYTYLLFSVMMEQYIVAYFWLVLYVYLLCERGKPERFALWGAGGSLLPSLIFVVSLSKKSPIRNFKGWIFDMVKYGAEFVALMLFFCRLDVITDFQKKVNEYERFTGKEVTFFNQFCQYTSFAKNYFLSPKAGVTFNGIFSRVSLQNHVSWQLDEVTTVSWGGLVILLLAIVSTVLNRKKRSGQCAALWFGLSVAMLLFLGWGTAENGLILYSLYFGWSFVVLLYLLVEYIAEKCKAAFVAPVICVVGAIVLAMRNIPAIFEMVDFASTYFPT